RLWPALVGGTAGVLFLAGAFVLIDAARSGDFLSFLPETLRGGIEAVLGIPPPAPGEGTRWHLEFMPYLLDNPRDAWLAPGLGLFGIALVFLMYRREGATASPVYKGLLGGLRIFLVLLTLAVLLPQLQLRFERQGWPDVVILIDDSRSMGEPDDYQDK